MKRSTVLQLAALGSLPLALAGCEQRQEPTTVVSSYAGYSDVDHCVSVLHRETVCRQAWTVAKAHHRANAPRYSSQQGCEAAFKRCEADEGQFMPQMEGFWVTTERQAYDDGQGSSGGGSSVGVGRSYDYVMTEPRFLAEALYLERDGRDGFRYSTVTDHANVLPARFTRASPAWRIGSKGGFGSHAPARSHSS